MSLDAAEFLRLLDEGGEAFDDAVAGLPSDVRPVARRYARIAAQRDRNAELVRVLYDTATDLAAITDVEAVLLAIVQRTRAVTGADMAYLSFNDHEAGETFIRKCDGVRTEGYRTIRMPLGTGVLGKAATGMAVVSTSDYVDDPSLVHISDIDRRVAEEGVRSILGVPMNVNGRVQGALLIADRRVVDYPPETVEVVDAIARQAAVALDYSARLARAEATLEKADASNREAEEQLAALRRLAALDRRWLEAVVAGGGVEAILDLLGEVCGARAEVVEPGSVAPGADVTVAPAKIGPRHLADVVLHGRIEPPDVVEHGALHVALIRLIDQIEADASHRSQYELMDDFLTGREASAGALAARLAHFGLSAKRPLALAVVEARAVADVVRMIRDAIGSAPALVAEHHGHVCVLHNAGDAVGPLVRDAMRADGFTPLIGTALVAGGVQGVRQAHRRAELALASVRLLGGDLLDGESIGSLGVLLEAEVAGDLPHSVVGPARALVEADAAKGTELVRTAWAVLEFGPGVPEVAARLFVHPNTLRQRLRRIGDLLGADWAAGPRRFDVHLALRAVMLQRELRGTGQSTEP